METHFFFNETSADVTYGVTFWRMYFVEIFVKKTTNGNTATLSPLLKATSRIHAPHSQTCPDPSDQFAMRDRWSDSSVTLPAKVWDQASLRAKELKVIES